MNRPFRGRQWETAPWAPAADVYRTSEGWLVKIELAGVRKSDVQVTLEGRRLTVAGVRRDWTLRDCLEFQSMEISYNRFVRSIELPADLSNAKIVMESEEGMLFVRLVQEGA